MTCKVLQVQIPSLPVLPESSFMSQLPICRCHSAGGSVTPTERGCRVQLRFLSKFLRGTAMHKEFYYGDQERFKSERGCHFTH